ncbi:hypothetical protein QQS21_011722 [Conoideocrella luteorostrata]|uniref:HTH La-type RNA-binding domain-containing protein n=1 Tax=Conoideocrella luteorostrata TaxID=1105319 RepID=A0AAJ0CFC9_9HYPO|nr:hypothetical protein QQS21_011722 [Conoideocrella luteorostrata]
MISTAESNSNEMAAASTFSYAQAAKGQGTSPSTTSPNPASLPHGATSPATAAETPIESLEGVRTAEPRPHAAVEKQDVDSNIGSESDLRSETTHDRHSESRRDDDSGRLDRPWRRTDKGTRSSSTATRSVDEQESRRPRKGKKSKGSSDKQTIDQASGADKTKEAVQECPKVELSEAPIPSVNIWMQRKEQQAKVKPSLSDVMTNGITSHDGEAKKITKDASPTTSSKENAPTNGAKSNRKAGESGRPDRNSSRGSRLADKDGKSELPPSVDDAASWPTPEITIKEEQKKPAATKPVATQEKETQDDGSQAKKHKDKWVTYDYVPTVNFETQLPQMRNTKPRGGARGTNNGRAAPTGAQQPIEKAAANASTNKPSESKERAKESSASSNRTNSLPPTSKRASMDASSTPKEQKKPSAQTGSDKGKDATASQPTQSTPNARSEGRTDRGRGGYRGRGAHPVNSHSHQHNGASFSNNGSVPARPQGPYSPPTRQGHHGQGFMPTSQRAGRARNGAAHSFNRMSLPAARLPPLQSTSFGPFEFPMHPMSATSFPQPPQYWDNMVVLKNQIEYYFSIENLCKDMYLRKRMDSQGFVNLHFIAAFKRIRELTQDMAMIRAACENSIEIDFVIGEDDIERLRRRNGWQNFILPMGDRDDFARNNGPSHPTYKNRPFNYGSPFNGAISMPFTMPPQMVFSPQGDGQFPQFPDSMPSGQTVNGMVNGNGNGHGHGSTQLSADVPDFAPSGSAELGGQDPYPTQNHSSEATNGTALTNGVHAE